MKLKYVLLTLAVGVIAFQARAQNRSQQLDHYFSSLAKQHLLNGNVLVAQKGRVIYQNSFGYADFSSKRPNTPTSTFPIASITKLFTTTAVLQLHQRGHLNINDLVVQHLPTFPYPSITIKHLLSHSSGLPPYDELFEPIRQQHPDTVFLNKDVLPTYAALNKPLLYQPGQHTNYDNVNFVFLSLLIEKVSQLAYHQYVSQFILKPVGMSHTFFPRVTFYHYSGWEKRHLSLTYRYPHLYTDQVEQTDTISYVERYWHAYNFKGFGELISTTQDLLKFDQALYTHQLVSQATLAQAFTPVNLISGQPNPGGYGLGWQISAVDSVGRLVSHEGGMIGLRAMFLRNITKQQVVIILDNTQQNAAAIAQQALLILNGHPPKLAHRSLAKAVGKLLMAGQADQARKLVERLPDERALYSVSEDEFNTLGYDFLQNDRLAEALVVFKINTQLFPKSWNTYDSYGEALLKAGQNQQAIKMYKKSLELGSPNEQAQQILDKLGKP